MSENTRLHLGVRLCLAESVFHCRSIAFIYIVDTSGRDRFLRMAPKNRKVAVSRHLICCNCSRLVQFVSSGCGKTWAKTRGERFVFTCKGCTEVKVLVKEVEGLKQMVEEMMEKVTGLRLVDKLEEKDSRVTKSGANQDSEEAAGNVRTEEMITGVEDEGEFRTEERKEICAGTPLMATHAYTKNQKSPVGKEIDLRQWDTLIFKGEHAENEHWRLVEDRNGQVGYAPAGFLVVILDTTAEEQESDATKNPASTITIPQPKPNRWFNVGPTATYLVGRTLLCSLDTRWPKINRQP